MNTDPRNILNGLAIPSENYVDQPYIVITQDGNWLCVLTTGPGQESQEGQHVVATISSDKGRTWSPLIDIESTHEPINSWVTAAVMPTGRAYAFYCYNADGISSMHGGWLAYRYSDDNGRTWSRRHRIEMRFTKKDRENFSGGKTQFWWCIDKPVLWQGALYFGIPKIHNGFLLDDDEGWVIRGDGIATATDPEQIVWHTLPDGDAGVVNPALGPVCEEQNIEVLSDGTLYMVNRTVSGYPSYAVSRDKGHTWTVPQIMRYADGRPIKTPRACPRIWKASNGHFLFWFHNNSFPGWGNSGNRNPVWVSGGIERDGDILWSQPEILLYAPDPTMLGMSYPDFVEQDGRYWASETQKMVARVHEINPVLLEAVWTQHQKQEVARAGLAFESQQTLNSGNTFDVPRLPSLDGGGFTLEMWLDLNQVEEGILLFSTLGRRRRGVQVSTAPNGTLKLEITDGQVRRWLETVDGPDLSRSVRSARIWNWDTDPWTITPGKLHHVVFIVDGAAKLVSTLVDGVLCDGGQQRIQGWWRLNPYLGAINEDDLRGRIGDNMRGRIRLLRIYDRYLLTSEAIGNYRAGLPTS